MAVLPPEGLDGGLVLKEGHHNVPVPGQGLLVDHHHVAGEDARLDHGLAPDLEGEMLAGEPAGVEGQVLLDVLLGQDGEPAAT